MEDEVLGSVQLLVSELVTNSVRHARLASGHRIRLQAQALPRAVRVEVTDPGQGFSPGAPSPNPSSESGWGLYLVDRVAHRWGVRDDGDTHVWFEIRR